MIKRLSSVPPLLVLEFFLLCIIVPGIIMVNRWAPFMFAFLWGATLYGFVVYRRKYFKHSGGWSTLWKFEAVTWRTMKPILLRWILASIGMIGVLYLYDPARLFYIPLERPQIIPWLLVAYPLVSALPQEFVFCSFFFKRYAPIFGHGQSMVIASTIVFAYAHCLYINPIAPTLSLLGGYIFASTFEKTKSLALVTIEHGLYGNSLFLIGLGWYFYGGSVTAG